MEPPQKKLCCREEIKVDVFKRRHDQLLTVLLDSLPSLPKDLVFMIIDMMGFNLILESKLCQFLDPFGWNNTVKIDLRCFVVDNKCTCVQFGLLGPEIAFAYDIRTGKQIRHNCEDCTLLDNLPLQSRRYTISPDEICICSEEEHIDFDIDEYWSLDRYIIHGVSRHGDILDFDSCRISGFDLISFNFFSSTNGDLYALKHSKFSNALYMFNLYRAVLL